MDISFESNIREWSRQMSRFEKQQLPFATAVALTETARDSVKPAVERRIEIAFDQPIPFTKKGVAYRPASKSTLVSRVFIKDIQSQYLKIEEHGGVRTPKGRAIPIPVKQRLNRYGNMPRGTVQRLLSRPDTFSGSVNGRAGIWQRTRKGLKLLVAWEDKATYQPIFKFYETARRSAELTFREHFRRAFQRAMATAR